MRKRYLFLVIAIAFGMALHMVEQYTTAGSDIALDGTPDEAEYYGERLTHREYDADGKLSQTLTAARSEYSPETGITQFESPTIIGERRGEENWEIQALKGILSDQGATLNLAGDVSIRSTDDQSDYVLIETSELAYHSKSGKADTDHPVTIRSNRGFTEANGLSMDIRSQRLTLKSDVRTRYEQN